MRCICVLTAVVIIAGPLVAGGCSSKEAEGKPFIIAWNYDTSGYIEPCGCSAHLLGGLPRRATKIAQLRAEQPVFAIEGAHFLEEGGGFQLFKSEILVKALNAAGYDALMLGVREAQQGHSGMRKIVELAEFPCFSANLKVEGESWPQPVVVTEIAGAKLAVTGVSQPEAVDFELPAGVSFADPQTSLESVLGGLGEDVDLIVTCLEGEAEWIEKVTQRFAKRVNLFLSGDRVEASHFSREAAMSKLGFVADPPRLNNLAQGRFLGLVTARPRRGGFSFSGTNFPLEDAIPDDQRVRTIIDQDFKPRLVDFFADFTGALPKSFRPAEICGTCHPEQYEVYLASGHHHSMETLTREGQLYNPDCMGCHLVYDPEKDELATMHCVSCHGNIIWDHVWQAEGGLEIKAPDPPVTAYSYDWCARCHDEANSLPFKGHWPQYANLVFHGGNMSAARAAAERMGLDISEHPPDLARPPAEE